MSTLQELNALRTAVGMKPLKAWKESKAKLDAAVAKLSGTASTEQQLKASVKVSKKAKKTKVEGISISTIADELDIDPKVARAKMRRAFGKKEEGKWPNSITEIKKLLQGDARKKA